MPRPIINKAVAVGVFVSVCGLAFLIAFTFFHKGGLSEGDSYVVFAYFEDATGLTWKSRVQIAGIPVGEVENITLVGNRARLDLRIKRDIDLHTDACLTKRFPSTLLPDALLEAVPGSVKAPLLRDLPRDQREIRCVSEATSVAKLLDTLTKVAGDIRTLTRQLSQMVAGSEGSIQDIIKNLAAVSADINRSVAANTDKVSAILDNAESFTGTLAEVASADREHYHAIAKNIADASARLDEVLKSVQGLVGAPGQETDLKKTVEEARQSLARINSTMGQIEKIATDVGEGKSIAGKLLTDERLGQKFSNTIESVSNYVERLDKLQLKVNLRSEWLLNQSGAKTYAGFALIPRPDRYYLLEVVNDPRGVDTQTFQTVTTSTAGGPVTTQTNTVVNEQKFAFSLEFAKRFGPMTFRIGLIENSGGVGADLHLLHDSLKLSVNVYQFSRPDEPTFPRAKLWLDYTIFKYVYATIGTDDFLNAWKAGHYPGGPKFSVGSDVFFGAGIVFTDDDLKALISVAGSAISTGASQAR